MLKLLASLFLSIFIVACENDHEPPFTTTSINNTNAVAISKLGFQQFLALHSNEILARNTIVSSPVYASPCISGDYTADFNDANNNNSLDQGDSVAETFNNCVLNTGNIRASGTINSSVTEFKLGRYSLNSQHTSLVITTLGNAKSYVFNGPLSTKITATSTLSEVENSYRGYTVAFGQNSTTINAGMAFVNINVLNNSYSIRHSLVFSATGVSGILRTDTTSAVIGISIDNEILISGDPAFFAADEDAAIQSKKSALDVAENISSPVPAVIAQLKADIFALEKSRKAFRAFLGRLRIESVVDNQFVEMISEDGDDDLTTYQQNVRADRVTTSTLGNKWIDLL